MHTRRYLALALLFLLAAPAIARAAEQQIGFTSIAEVETIMYDSKGQQTLVRSPASLVNPGEIAIYTNRFVNNGTEPAADIVVNNPVPKNTEYLQGSATEEGYALTFSVDGGKTFGKPGELTVTGKDGKPRPASAKDYTHIRWTSLEPLPPGASGQVEFRILVK